MWMTKTSFHTPRTRYEILSKQWDLIWILTLNMSERSTEMARTLLRSEKDSDLVLINCSLFRAAKDPYTKSAHKTVALFMIAVLLCHEYAHILEYRCVQNEKLLPSGEPLAFHLEPHAAKQEHCGSIKCLEARQLLYVY